MVPSSLNILFNFEELVHLNRRIDDDQLRKPFHTEHILDVSRYVISIAVVLTTNVYIIYLNWTLVIIFNMMYSQLRNYPDEPESE